ncbi:interleukin-15 receptor subunit alpha isoform X1 [Melanotaenia boesemani]|uniref:interleukin-15 receptor subunit alpha isoform X1 n=1 Tax=Melanotaenia boesemani TaxID=1250792 RepID=UPI001C05C21E|nr:interleukin-15 receptor subunit alpha isoform X1 [Melanotaenia boesemani]
MDMDCFSFYIRIMMVCLLGIVRFSSGENCTCPPIPPRSQTEPPDTEKCFKLNERFRYNCTKDYVRKAGTSNLITCKNTSGTVAWTKSNLECIPHPDKPRPPSSTPKTSTSLQTDRSLSTTEYEGINSTQPTPQAKTSTSLQTNWSLSTTEYEGMNSTQPTPQETLTQTTNTCTTQNSTLSPITDNPTSTEPSPQVYGKVVGISLSSVVVICSVIGLCFFLQRRRSRRYIPQGTPKEMVQLNLPSEQP